MNTIDGGVETGLSMNITVAKLTGQIVIESLDQLLQSIRSHAKNNKKIFTEAKTHQGKMKLNKLFEKHQKGEIISLKDNISKEEYLSLKKEFKKMGVDFSIRRVDENEYSLFFCSKDSSSIEKGMENAIKKYSKKQDKKQTSKFSFNTKKLRIKQKEIDAENKSTDIQNKRSKIL